MRKLCTAGPLLVLALLTACSGLKYVPAGEKLYVGSDVKLNASVKPRNEVALQTELESVVRPRPNKSFLGLRPKLFFWHLGEGKKKGLGKALADKFGEAPVFLSQVKIATSEALITNRLYSHGFFQGKVTHEVKEEARTARVDYTATVGKAYTIRSITWPAGDSLLNAAIRNTQGTSLLKVGDDYNLNVFTAERVRIDAILKNKGFYYFGADGIIFDVDSTLNGQVDVFVAIKGSVPPRSRVPYQLRNVSLHTNYVLTDTTTRRPILFRKYRYFPDEKVFKARAITNAVFLYPRADSVYSRRRRDQTLSRLMSLGTFKFIEIRFRPASQSDSLGAPAAFAGGAVDDQAAINTAADLAAGDTARIGLPRLDAEVLMTQIKKKSIRSEIQLLSKSNGFSGPGFITEFRNRSALRGGEQLLLNLTGTFENQTRANTDAIGLTSYEIGVNARLLVPRLITPPFDIRLPNSDFQPRTTFGAGYRFVERLEAFRVDVFSLNYGYSWKTKLTNEQELRPVDVQYNRVANQSGRFLKLLEERPFLENSFRQQFILGSSYRYTYNQQVLEERRQQIFFSGGVEVSGNLASLAAKGLNQRTDAGRLTIAGQEFSQYAKLDLELREYFRISADPTLGNRIVGRLLVGLGLPYGNSTVLPYLRQYGVGGPNSIRAFPARGVGPGTYKAPESSTTTFYDQVGDLRLEGNLEYRQDLIPYLKGAVFLDAGNIWLVNTDTTRRGGEFNASTFLQQLAIGYGAGLRLDVQFFIVRLDYALPLRAGYGTPTGVDKRGRLNLAIGYPF